MIAFSSFEIFIPIANYQLNELPIFPNLVLGVFLVFLWK